MIKRRLLAHAVLIASLYIPLNVNADQSALTCDVCSKLDTLNTTETSTNNFLQKLLAIVTDALFGNFYSIDNTMSAFTAVPAVENNGYSDQQALLTAIETSYQGSSDQDATFTNNYSTLFNDYFLGGKTPFNPSDASISALYLNPTDPASYYSDDQSLSARRYIMLVSGAAESKLRKPDSWLTENGADTKDEKTKIRQQVTDYYTFSAMQSAVADNFAYIYGLNTGQAIDGSLDQYSSGMISASGLLTYIQSQKAENVDWYSQLKTLGVADLLREQAILLGGSFLMLSRIEEDLRRLLVTNSVQTSLNIMTTQTQATALSSVPTSVDVGIR